MLHAYHCGCLIATSSTLSLQQGRDAASPADNSWDPIADMQVRRHAQLNLRELGLSRQCL